MQQIEIPAGYMQDTQGRLVPKSLVKQIDLERNELVADLIIRALDMERTLNLFRTQAMADIQAFVELSGEQYGAKMGGTKGNVSLYAFDGSFKIERAMSDFIRFDERLQAAKVLVDDCLNRWSEKAPPALQTLVRDAFQVDKQGRINMHRILSLRRVEIEDETWKDAMQAISDSVQVVNSKAYLRFYQRGDDGSYRLINLNIAG